MKCFIRFLSFVFLSVERDRHFNVNGYFRKRHTIGNKSSAHACNRGPGIYSTSKIPSVANINVSTTIYSSNEQIVISWAPVSTPCKDDFVGIYFIDIDPSKGKHI
jgi:hypothetical protein